MTSEAAKDKNKEVNPQLQKSGNWISNLWSDEKNRQVLIQIFVLVFIFLLIGYFIRNTLVNLEALGREAGYGFLLTPSNYDINQHLIEYSSRSTHLRATIVGIINTALVAFFGIVLATALGFFVGILRLSSNWLVNRLSYLFVEFNRNVPLLLWILLYHGIIVHSLPHPRTPVSLAENVHLTNRGFFIPKHILEIEFWWVVIALILGLVGAYFFTRYARQVQEQTGQHYPVSFINAGILIILPIITFYLAGSPASLEYPEFKGFNFQGGLVLTPEFIALTAALGVYTSAFIAEIVRAGILAVSHGQTEASYALGLKANWTLRLVILPQALRVIIPPLISQYLNLTKNSSLAIAVGYMDIVATIGGISLNQTGRALECMSIVLSIYLCISLGISALMNMYNKRFARVER